MFDQIGTFGFGNEMQYAIPGLGVREDEAQEALTGNLLDFLLAGVFGLTYHVLLKEAHFYLVGIAPLLLVIARGDASFTNTSVGKLWKLGFQLGYDSHRRLF